MKSLAEVTGLNKIDGRIKSISEPTSVNHVLICFQFFNKLLEKKIFLSDFFSIFFIVEEKGKAMIVIDEPLLNTVNFQDEGREMIEFLRMALLNLFGKINFAEAHVMNIFDQLENVDFETGTAEVLGDRVQLVQMTPEFKVEENTVLYGYFWRQEEVYLVLRIL
jgi:hypothetical protein